MLPGTADRLQLAFTILNNGHIVQVPQLTKDHPYPVVGARRVNGQYGSTVLFTLRSEGDINFKGIPPKEVWRTDRRDGHRRYKFRKENVQIDFHGNIRSGIFAAPATVMPGRTPKKQ